MSNGEVSPGHGAGEFVSTHWSLVEAAGDASSSRAAEALEELCNTYWLPLYAYVRRRVDEHEAQDLTQEFFARFLERNDFAAACRERGRFRAYLLTALKHFLANEWDRKRAKKRGGGRRRIALDFRQGESILNIEPDDPTTPEQIYQRQWALQVLEAVLEELRQEFLRQGRAEHFAALKVFLAGAPRGSYREIAEQLSLTEGAARMAVQRLRARYRELLRRQIARTVSTPEEVDEEIASLFAAFQAPEKIR